MKRLLSLLIIPLCISACDQDKVTNPDETCGDLICTEMFATVTVKFVDNLGVAINVRNYSVINTRTKDTLSNVIYSKPRDEADFYMVASDADLKTISATGDTIIVSGLHPSLNTKAEGKFVIKGGKCNCHIQKVSGPTEIKFN